MIRNFFTIKLIKNFINFLFSLSIHKNLKTTNFRIGKQTTFLCGNCGVPFHSADWVDVQLANLSPLADQHLISSYFKILKYKTFYRGAVVRPQVHYYHSIKDKNGELMSCGECHYTRFQNILLFKIMDINVAVVL